MVSVTVPSDNPDRRAQGVTYTVVVDDPEERDSCTCPSYRKIAARSGAWEDVGCRHLLRVWRERLGKL